MCNIILILFLWYLFINKKKESNIINEEKESNNMKIEEKVCVIFDFKSFDDIYINNN